MQESAMWTKIRDFIACVTILFALISEAVPPGGPSVKKRKPPEEFVPPSKPDYSQLEKAGYYKDPGRNPALKNTLFISGINYSYRDFFHNFRCFTDRLGIRFLPISLDEHIYTYLTTNNIEAVAGALKLGYDVVFSDVDIALLKDPIG
eukprot:gene34591-44720_t